MSRKKDALGDRMKRYEAASNFLLTRRTCIIIRADGQAFHTYTKGFNRPFDDRIIKSMEHAAKQTAAMMTGFKLGYVQSDEASFLVTDYDDTKTQAWFDNSLPKLVTVTASWMTAHFNRHVGKLLAQEVIEGPGLVGNRMKLIERAATFDARAFVVPESDVANYFLWRAKDWDRNSLSMYAAAHYPAKDLHGKKRNDRHEMLHAKGRNWAKDLTDQQRNGTFLTRTSDQWALRDLPHPSSPITSCYGIRPTYAGVSEMVNSVLPREVDEAA